MGSRGMTVLVVGTLSLGLVAAACTEEPTASQGAGGGEGGESTDEGGTIAVAGEEANDHGSEDVSGASQTSLGLDDFYFEPTVLEGDAGQSLTIELENEGDATHTFTTVDQSVDQELAPGESAEVTVTFPESGALGFFCRFHGASGMRGGLSVGGDLTEAASAGGGTETGGDTGGGYGS